MQILKAKYILTPTKILVDKEIAFQERILAIGDNLEKKYPHAKVKRFENAAILPGFCNPHIHLEFSANRAMLSYGDFLLWLQSVIKHREQLIPKCDKSCLEQAIKSLIQSGTTTIGAISSYGEDLQACVQSPLNVAYFSEIIGSNPATADVMYADFLERYYRAKKYESVRFQSCVAIHSPYAVHRVLAQKALEIAKKDTTLVSVHFMESKAEREWIDSDSGEFRAFFQEFLGQKRAANRALEFLELFEDLQTLYVHAIWSKEEELEKMRKKGTIIHCPISNRLLGNGVLDIDKVERFDIPYTIATDGLSSNYTLNLYEELRAALFLHPSKNAITFAKELLLKATQSAKWLGFESGSLEEGNFADLQVVPIPQDLQVVEEIYLHIILHTQKPISVYLKGVAYE